MTVYIKSIEIQKIRHLENVNINICEKGKRHLIITGKNGSGKTTVLENIKNYLKSIEADMYNEINYTYKNDLKIFRSRVEEIDKGINLGTPDEKERLVNGIRDRENTIANFSNGLIVNLSNDEMISSKYKNGEFILAYFNAKRYSKVNIANSVNKVELQNSYSIDADIDTKFLDYLVYLKTQQSFARNEGDMETVKSIGVWFDNLQSSLQELFEDTTIRLKFDYRNLVFKIQQQDKEEFGFNELSDGFSAVLDIVMNLILRMEKNKNGLIYDKEGIVLIDEVETHLHIELQKKIMPFLTSFFPKIQFIVSTHSPFVLSSLENAVIYDLEKRIKVEDLSGYAYDGIVESYFDIDKYSNSIKEKIDKYEKLTLKETRTEEEDLQAVSLRGYLKNIPKELAPELAYKFNSIELLRKTKQSKKNLLENRGEGSD
jgi:predicted ATP-binding protein involved in virulence